MEERADVKNLIRLKVIAISDYAGYNDMYIRWSKYSKKVFFEKL